MKVILTRDVKGVGRAHEAIQTKDGYALNYLIPKRLAIAATPRALTQAKRHQASVVDRKQLDATLLAAAIASLATAELVIARKANEKNHLYDTVAAPEIVAALREQAHIDIPEDAIRLEKPIKDLGTFRVSVAEGDVFGEFSIRVVAE